MVPTEILAKQHFAETVKILGDTMRVGLLTASLKPADKRETLARLAAGEIDIIIGTHALIQPDVVMPNLGLAITDEQHRFGVDQRLALSSKGGVPAPAPHCGNPPQGDGTSASAALASLQRFAQRPPEGEHRNTEPGFGLPDVLVMTATPIPRTLAFILYGDLDISVIDELPPGRKKIVTRAVGQDTRADVYKFVRDKAKEGLQAYVVTPLIEDSDDETGVMDGVRSAESVYEEVSAYMNQSGIKTALLHGQMKQSEKDAIMQSFVKGEISVLVSTVVIEVGVNVPNAAIMVVENAERFGLAQLHQLRGRVGRGEAKSYCVLVLGSDSDDAKARAKVLTDTADGFKIAEQDLKMRGPGELFGVRQHGIPDLRLADPVKNIKILEEVVRLSEGVLTDDPALTKPENRQLRERLKGDYADIGL
jgi:ATP-dependent DNA helicase RecG